MRIGLAALLAGVAVLLLLFAVAAWRVPDRVSSQDRQLLARVAGETAWTGLKGPVPGMLGVLDDRSYRLAVARFLQARRALDPIGSSAAANVVASTEASVLLGRIENGRSGKPVRSRAANLDAVVIGEGAELNGDVAALDAAVGLLRKAIRLDRSNEAAKANLERLVSGSSPTNSIVGAATTGTLVGKPGGGAAGGGY
jgi:hypothetical protein